MCIVLCVCLGQMLTKIQPIVIEGPKLWICFQLVKNSVFLSSFIPSQMASDRAPLSTPNANQQDFESKYLETDFAFGSQQERYNLPNLRRW